MFGNSKLDVVLIGDPLLRDIAKEIPLNDVKKKDFQNLIDDMFRAMRKDKGVGLASPQVGISKRFFVLEKKMTESYPEVKDVPQDVFINPKILSKSGNEEMGLEGCLSIPNLFGEVPRATSVEVEAFDRDGKKFKLKAEGFYARVILHEYDHLDGVLFVDRVRDTRSLRLEF